MSGRAVRSNEALSACGPSGRRVTAARAVTTPDGVAMRTSDMDSVDALIKCADDGVYRAKQRGRNCIAALQLESGAG